MPRQRISEIDAFWDRTYICMDTGCWLWLGQINSQGYSRFKWGGVSMLGHRYSYNHFKGELDSDLVIDHLCRVRRCVNPDHLEQVTDRENILRGFGCFAQNARKSYCDQGHEFTEENTYVVPEGRKCKICRANNGRRFLGWSEDRIQATPIGPVNAAKTHCKQGHAFTEDNIYRIGSTRVCATCRKAQQRAYNARKRAKSLAA